MNVQNEIVLSRFIEIYEERYNQIISIAELFKMKDVVLISKNKEGGRTIRLLARNYNVTSLHDGGEMMQELLRLPYCTSHSPLAAAIPNNNNNNKQRAASLNAPHQIGLSPPTAIGHLPNVIISLRFFKTAVHKLLHDHGGQMPLASFMYCYKHCIYDHFEQSSSLCNFFFFYLKSFNPKFPFRSLIIVGSSAGRELVQASSRRGERRSSGALDHVRTRRNHRMGPRELVQVLEMGSREEQRWRGRQVDIIIFDGQSKQPFVTRSRRYHGRLYDSLH